MKHSPAATTLLLGFAILVLAVSSARGEALDPQTAVKQLQVADGLEVELFAAEPMVRQPVTMSFDDRGRLWVLQYLQYPVPAGLKAVSRDQYDRVKYDRIPEPPPRGPRGADRVTILEDTDGDGRADKAADFIDGLNLATGPGNQQHCDTGQDRRQGWEGCPLLQKGILWGKPCNSWGVKNIPKKA